MSPRCLVLAVGLVAACAARRSTPGDEEEGAAPRPAHADADARAERDASPDAGAERACLPVVAAECGCVYSCAEGRLQEDGSWLVRHPFWGETPIRARRDRFCVGDECTEAFFGEIVCGLICAPRPADSTCRFDAEGRCASGRPGGGADDAGPAAGPAAADDGAARIPPMPSLSAPAGSAAIAGPGFAFLVPFVPESVTFDLGRPGAPVGGTAEHGVLIKSVKGDAKRAVAEAVRARKGAYAVRVTSEKAAKLGASAAVELETEAKTYVGHTLERYAAIEGWLVEASCVAEGVAFEPRRPRCVAFLDGLHIARAAPASPHLVALGAHVALPPGVEPAGASTFRPGNESMEGFVDVRLTVVRWVGKSLDDLATEMLGQGYVLDASRRRTKRDRGGTSLYLDNETAGGAPIIRQLQRYSLAGDRAYVLGCETDAGSFSKVRPICARILASLVLAP